MDPISVIIMLTGAGVVGRLITNDGHLTRKGRMAAQQRQYYQQIRHRKHQVAAGQARQFQVAILALESNPDFQRVAAAVRAAEHVPPHFKLRQYHRFRPHFIRHYRRCAQRGADLQQLRTSLDQLVMAFELEPFEADYLRSEAERNLNLASHQQAPETAVDNFRSRIARIQEEHDERVTAIRELTGIEDDVREQLLEAEERRYQSQLFQHDNNNGGY